MLAKSSLLTEIGAFPHAGKGDDKSAASTLCSVHPKLALTQRTLEAMISSAAKSPPTSKQGWFPFFHAEMKALCLIGALKFGFVGGC
jgi:hypothetical protein